MEPVLPSALSENGGSASRAGGWVVRGERDHECLRFTGNGFEIAADGRPPLRGLVDLLCDGVKVARLLVVCVKAEGGRVAYEVKRGGAGIVPRGG